MKRRNWEEKEERRFRIGLLIILVLVFVAIHFLDPTFYPTIYYLSETGDLNGMISYLQSFGMYAAFMSFFADVVVNIVGFLPSIFISTANGLIFGLFWGTIISWLAETVGVILSFYVMRTLFRGMAKHIIEKSQTLTQLDAHESWQAMAIARAIPYMPNGLVTAVGALSSMSFRDYAFGCLVGKFPSVALEVILGHDMVHFEENSLRLTIVLVVVSAVYGGLWWFMKKKKQKSKKSC